MESAYKEESLGVITELALLTMDKISTSKKNSPFKEKDGSQKMSL